MLVVSEENMLINGSESLKEVEKFGFVDALRGWAFLSVLAGHVEHWILPSVFSPLAKHGALGVQLFFIVSAFTLFFSFYVRGKEKNAIKAFGVRRFFRIAPMFWTAILFYLSVRGFKSLYGFPHEITPWRILSTLLFINGWHPNTINNVVPGGWTIAVEMSFYLLLPLFFRYVSSLRKALFCSILLLIFRVLANSGYTSLFVSSIPPDPLSKQLLDYWLPNQIPVFSFGFILFFLIRDRLDNPKMYPDAARERKEKYYAGGLLLIFSTILFLSSFSAAQGMFFPKHITVGLGFLFFAWALAVHPFAFFVNRFTNYVGKVSYSAYLSHFFILDLVVKTVTYLGKKYHLAMSWDVCFAAFFLGTLAGTLSVSTITYTWIEQPFQRLGKKLIRRYL